MSPSCSVKRCSACALQNVRLRSSAADNAHLHPDISCSSLSYDIPDPVDGPTTTPAASSSTPACRMRTVLTEYQLRVLRTCYAVFPRPDAATRDQLMEMTGLGARVIRVWFQNRRCKDKKKKSAARRRVSSSSSGGI